MKIIVISDSHGNTAMVKDIISTNSTAEVVIFCGDGCSDIEEIRYLFPTKMIISVRGNCDWYCNSPDSTEITLCGKKIFITHGQLYGVKEYYSPLIAHGHNINADIVLFGHTHIQYASVDDSMLVMNPGSCAHSKYFGIIEIDDNGNIKADGYLADKKHLETITV